MCCSATTTRRAPAGHLRQVARRHPAVHGLSDARPHLPVHGKGAALSVRLRPELHHASDIQTCASKDSAVTRRCRRTPVNATAMKWCNCISATWRPRVPVPSPAIGRLPPLHLRQGQRKTVSFTLKREQLAAYDDDGKPFVAGGKISSSTLAADKPAGCRARSCFETRHAKSKLMKSIVCHEWCWHQVRLVGERRHLAGRVRHPAECSSMEWVATGMPERSPLRSEPVCKMTIWQ